MLLAFAIKKDLYEEEASKSITGVLRNITRKLVQPFQSRLRVLLIDDSSTVLQIMTKWLEKQGCIALCAENGKEGLHALQALPFDLCFVDFLMPVMHGVEMVKAHDQWMKSEGIITYQYSQQTIHPIAPSP